MKKKRYQLRAAAGNYWLLDMQQEGREEQCPVELNESGALLWGLMEKDMNLQEIALYLSENYEINIEDAKEDVTQFLEGLRRAGITL